MSAIAGILVGVAAKVGAPIVKELLEKHLGGTAGQMGGAVVDAIAAEAGVPPERLAHEPPSVLEEAVLNVEMDPQLILAHVEAQKLSNQLQLAEMEKDSAFGWMWRPAGMWLMLACIAWYIIISPLLNALLSALGAREGIVMIVDFASFVTVFVTYTTFYLGGHTAKSIFAKGGK